MCQNTCCIPGKDLLCVGEQCRPKLYSLNAHEIQHLWTQDALHVDDLIITFLSLQELTDSRMCSIPILSNKEFWQWVAAHKKRRI